MSKVDYSEIKENIMIVDYARFIGLTPCRIGSYYSLKEHDSVRIDPKKNIFYRNSTGEHGTVIDFALAFTGMSLKEVLKEFDEIMAYRTTLEAIKRQGERTDLNKKELLDTSGQKLGSIDIIAGKYGMEKNLVLPAWDNNMRNVYAYLTKTRGIDRDIVDRMVKDKMLYQDDHKNCVFVSYEDSQPVFACIRGTNTYKRFLADVTGSDYSKGFLIRNGSNILCIVESVIDALSLMTMGVRTGEKLPDFLCLSGATKDDAVYYRLKSGSYEKVYVALDNDTAGQKAAMRISWNIIDRGLLKMSQVISVIPKYKDWNEDLLALKGVE